MFRLLICDDHPPIRTVLRLLAKEANGNCDVTETGSAQELLAELEVGERPAEPGPKVAVLRARYAIDHAPDARRRDALADVLHGLNFFPLGLVTS